MTNRDSRYTLLAVVIPALALALPFGINISAAATAGLKTGSCPDETILDIYDRMAIAIA
jgi:hypothetical protein